MCQIVKDCNGIPLGAEVLVRIPRGMRKRDKFLSALGRKPEYLYSFRFEGHFCWVSRVEFAQVKGKCTKARVDTTKLLKCWGN